MSSTLESAFETASIVVRVHSLHICFMRKKASWTIGYRANEGEELTLPFSGSKSLTKFVFIWTWALLQVWWWGLSEPHVLISPSFSDGCEGIDER